MESVETLRESNAQSKNIRRRRGLLAAAVAAVIAGGALMSSARAGTFTWDINQSGNWTTPTSWVGGIAPTGADATDRLIFGGVEGGSYTASADTIDPFVINGLTLNSSATTTTQFISFANSQGISLSGTNPFITNNGTGAFQIDAPLILAANTTLSGTGAGQTLINGAISGTGALNVSGGIWQLTNANNSWTGGTNITGGRLELNSNESDLGLLATGSTLLGTGGTFNINAATAGGQAELRLISGAGQTLIGGASRPIIFGANGGTVSIDGRLADGQAFTITTPTTAGASPAVFKWNGGPNHISSNNPNDGNWSNGVNALRLNITNAGPVRVELDQGAMFVMPNVGTLANPLTVMGVKGGDPTSGPDGTVHTGTSLTTGRLDLPNQTTYVVSGGLSLGGALQTALEGAARAIDGNITILGTASGNPGIVSFHGRGTNTDFGTGTLNPAGTTTAGHNVLYIGVGGNDTFTIQDGGTATLDLRIRTEVAFANGVLVNSRTVLNPGGTLRVLQSISNFSPVTPAPSTTGGVGYEMFQGNIEAQGSSAKESVINLYVPFKNTLVENSPFGGVEFQSTSNLIINGTGTGGLMVKGTARPNNLFEGGASDPVSNADKVANLLSATRLAALTGSGGYLTPAPAEATFNFPNGGEWAPAVTVGLKVVNSNSTGDDVALSGPFQHNVIVDSGATLNAGGNTLGPATVTANLGLVRGTGTLSNAIINRGARLAPGIGSIGTMNASGTLRINGTYEADVTTAAQDLLAVNGDLSMGPNSVLDLPATNTYNGSAYTLITYSGGLNSAFTTVNNLPAGYIVDYGTSSNSSIRLVVPAASTKYWTGATNSDWDTATNNWKFGTYSDGNDVIFDDSATGSTSVNISGAVTPNSVTIANAAKNYTIGGAAITGSTGITKLFTGTATLTGNNSFTGAVDIKNGVIAVGTISDSGISGPLGSGSAVNLGNVGSAGTLRFTGATGTTNRSIALSGNGGIFDVTTGSLTLNGNISGAAPLSKIGSGTLIINADNSATLSGPVTLLGSGTTTAAVAGSLGSGAVTVGDGTSANSNVLNYNAAGAAGSSPGVTATTLSTVNLGANLGGSDRITVQPDAVLTVNSFGASVNRSTNLNAAAGAIIAESAPGQNNALANKGNSADIYFGLAANLTDSIAVGGSNPWKGISTDVLADRTLNNGSSISAGGDFTLHSINGRKLTLGASGGGVTITGGPVNANIASYVVLAGTSSSYNNVNFDVAGGSTLELLNPTVLGSGANLGHVTVENNGLLKVSNSTAANGAVNVLAGGVMDVSIPGFSGSGVLTEQPGGIVQINNAGGLTGTQLTGPGIGSGAVVRMNVDNITNINTVNGAAVFEVFGTGATRTEDAGINLSNGGILTQDNNNATLASAAGVTIGSGGGTLASTTGKTLTFGGNITTTNPLTIGTTANIDGNAKLGTVNLGGTISAPISIAAGTGAFSGTLAASGTVDVLNGIASFTDGAVLNGTVNTQNHTGPGTVAIHAGHSGAGLLTGTGSINLGNGGEVIGYADDVAAAPAPRPVNLISNLINILPSGGTLTVDREGPAVSQTGLVRFGNVQLAPASTLSVRRINGDMVADLTLLGDAAVQGITTGNADRIGNVTDNNAGRTLTIKGTEPIRMVGTLLGTTRVTNIDTNTVQLNSSTFAPNYTSSFLLNNNTYEQQGNRNAAVNGLGANPLNGYTGSGTTTLQVDPGAGTVRVSGGIFNINSTAPNTTFTVSSGRVITDRTMTLANLNVTGNIELLINNQNATTFSNITLTNFNLSPHAGFVFQPNADDNLTANPPTGPGRSSFLRITNNPPVNVNGMVSPSMVRKSSGSNEGFFLRYDATNGFMTALPTVSVVNPNAGGANMPATTLASDIVSVDGSDTDAAPNVVTVPMVSQQLTFWALKTDQSITGAGTKLNIGSGGIIFFQGNNQNRTIEPDVSFGNAEAFIYGREGGDNFNYAGNKNRDTLAGTVSGTAGLTKFGGGDLWLSGNNTLTGPITIQRGRLVINGGSGIGTGGNGGDGRNNPLTINANTAAYNNNSNHHPSTFDLAGTLQSVDGVNGNGAITSSSFGAPLIIDKTLANGGSATFTGAIFGSVQLFKRGAGTQILAPGAFGDSTYTDGTIVEGGTLLVNNTSGSGTGAGAVVVSAGATLGGAGSIAGFTNINNGGHLAPGSAPGKVGTFNLQGLSLDGGILDYDGDATGMDRLNVGSDGIGVSGGSNIINVAANGLASGDYVIIDYTNGNPDMNQLQLGPAPAGYALSLVQDVDNTNILLHVVSSGPPQWNVDGNGSWGLAGNWQGGIPAVGGNANFLGKITAPRTITLDGNRSVANVNFDNANKYTITQGSSGTLTITSAITVTSGTHEISAPLSLSGAVTKSGPGTLIISGPQSNPAGSSLTVAGGAVNLNSNAGASATATSAASANLALTVSGSSVVLGANQDLASLNIATANAGTQSFDLASPSTAGSFRAVHIYAADLAGAKTSLYNAIKNAISNAGDGIFDSGLAAHASSKLGIAQVADAHGDQSILIRPTRVGDLNLDGSVSISDFIDLASHFGGSGTWQEGDLNYDGSITISDFIDLASNFGATYSGNATVASSSDVQTLASFSSSIGVDPSIVGSAVPEPSTLALAAFSVCTLLSRADTRKRVPGRR